MKRKKNPAKSHPQEDTRCKPHRNRNTTGKDPPSIANRYEARQDISRTAHPTSKEVQRSRMIPATINQKPSRYCQKGSSHPQNNETSLKIWGSPKKIKEKIGPRKTRKTEKMDRKEETEKNHKNL